MAARLKTLPSHYTNKYTVGQDVTADAMRWQALLYSHLSGLHKFS